MNTINFKLAIILGAKLEEIKTRVEQFESMHLGLFINSLRYKNEKEGKRLKNDFLKLIRNGIKFINKNINELNVIIKYLNSSDFNLTLINKIDYKLIKQVILKHKDHPQPINISEILGEGDSPSVLARQHTALQVKNIIFKTKLSLSDFLKSLDRLLEIFDSVDLKSFRFSVKNEIERSRTAYSVGLFGESIFILGRLLENLVTEYILLLKERGKINLNKRQILNLDFHQKIGFLHSKELSILSDSQFSKIMSVKWDRNTYGHEVNSRAKDYRAIITISLLGIDFLDKKIRKTKKKHPSVPKHITL